MMGVLPSLWYNRLIMMNTHKVYTYAVILEPEEKGGFTVHVPALPEIVTCDDDETEALAMAKDAIELVIESRLERGESIPSENVPVRQVSIQVAA